MTIVYIGHAAIPAARKEQPKPICDLSSFSTIVPCEEPPLHVPTVRLRRSRTAPSRRRKYGEHEPPQVVHVNRYASQGILLFSFSLYSAHLPFFLTHKQVQVHTASGENDA